MRISDGSSDVCSSDLVPTQGFGSDGRLRAPPSQYAHPALLGNDGNMGASFADSWGSRRVEERPVVHRSAWHRVLDDPGDRKRVVSGKSVSVRVDFGGRRIIKKKKLVANRNMLE